MAPPIASSARKEIAPMAVWEMRWLEKAPGRFRGKAQGVVLQSLVGDPLIVLAPDGHDALACGHPLISA